MSAIELTMALLESALPRTAASDDPLAERAAAVAAIVRNAPFGVEVLFIRRAERDGDPWSGHMAFPGGRRDPSDTSLLETAIRETAEEIGLDLRKAATLIGVLDDQDASGRGARSPMPLRPFVFRLDEACDFSLNDREVQEVVWTPLARLLSDESRTSITINYHGQDYTLPAWDVGGRIVWGLTYWMLSSLLEKLALSGSGAPGSISARPKSSQ